MLVLLLNFTLNYDFSKCFAATFKWQTKNLVAAPIILLVVKSVARLANVEAELINEVIEREVVNLVLTDLPELIYKYLFRSHFALISRRHLCDLVVKWHQLLLLKILIVLFVKQHKQILGNVPVL